MNAQRARTIETLRLAAPLLIVGIGVLGFLVLRNKAETQKTATETEAAPLVDTAKVVDHAGDLTLDTDGHVVPFREIVLSAEVSGRVASKAEACRTGKSVRQGEVLLEVDSRDYVLAEQQLLKQEAQATANLKELDVEISNTNQLMELANDDREVQARMLQRSETLHETLASSESEVDQAMRSLLQARNAELMLKNQLALMDTRKARLQSAKELIGVQLDKARLDLARCRIVSPVDGVVVEESVEADSYVQKGATLLTIEDTSAVEVQCSLQTNELFWVWSQRGEDERDSFRRDYELPETPATVTYHLSGNQYAWDGVLWRYDGIGVDERTRTVPCLVLVPKPNEVRVLTAAGEETSRQLAGPPALVRGMFVNLKIHTRPDVSLLRTEFSAIRPGKSVWRVRDGVLKAVGVEIIEVANDQAVIRALDDEQLQSGDLVVISPLADATDGMRVRTRLTNDEQLATASPAPLLPEGQQP